MTRFFAVVGLVALVAACSDSNMAPVSRAQPRAAARDVGDPPPPPLSPPGAIDADLDVFGSDALAPLAASTNSVPQCSAGQDFFLSLTFSYLLNKPGTNEVAHMDVQSPGTGSIDIHQNTNGGSNANGSISQGGNTFKIQSGDGTIDPVRDATGKVIGLVFEFSVTGFLTDETGFTCQASASFSNHST